MTISNKKINVLIDTEFSEKINAELLIKQAKQIYAMESSSEGESDRDKIEIIKSQLATRADEFLIED